VNSELFRRGLGYSLSALIVGLFSIVFFTTPVHAVVTAPNIMNFQGRLTDTSGNPLNGSYDMQLKLWDSPTVGTVRWSETRLAANSQAVTVTNGLFSLKLGVGSTQTGSLTTAFSTYPNLYFEITVGAETLTTRSQIATSAYAFNSDTLDGIDSTAFSQLSTANAFTNTNSITTASASAFIVNNGTSNIFKVDSSGTGQVVIGTSDTNGTVLVLDSNASDPTGTNGAMYYNSGGKFRCYQGGAWADCVTAASTLQTAYNASGSPATITTTAAKAVSIVAGAAPTVDMFNVSNIGQPNVTAGASGIQVTYVGGPAAVEASGVRVDLTPGTTSGGTWNGMRVVANPTGAASGVQINGIKLEGPTSIGAGSETGMYIGTGWDTGLDVQSGGLNLAGYTSAGVPADPAAPVAGNLRVYAKKVAGRMMLKWKAPSGVDTALQPSLAFNTIQLWTPSLTATGVGFGTVWPAGTGTFSSVQPTAGMANQLRRTRFANTAATNQILGLTASTAAQIPSFWRGNAAGQGGFFMQTRFETDLVPATSVRLFVGLTSMTTGAAAADTVTGNVAGLSHITTDGITTMTFMTRDNTTTSRAATFTVPAMTSGNAYDFSMYAAPNDTVIYYRLVDLLTGSVLVDSSTSTNLPLNTAFLGPQVQMSNGTANLTATTTAIAINKIYIESDN